MLAMRLSWDIFCSVIDNFGDIGVCWRLARQLAGERAEPVRLWVDDLAAFAQLERRLDATRDEQDLDGVNIQRWHAPFPAVQPQAVVIEAFACNPPADFLAAMAAQRPPPVWINLEYLSAEAWVEGCHALGSRHPRLPLTHHFFFPGFTAKTGGLLREADLLAARDVFQTDQGAQQQWLSALGLDAQEQALPRVSLFCYDNPVLAELLAHWSQAQPLCLLVADGKPRRAVAEWLGEDFPPGSHVQRGQLRLIALPFLPQSDYDRLLWACQFNFVRGEDSFVRAQWAARPMAWHIYPQEEDAHLIKLDAFLARYTGGLSTADQALVQGFWQAWNRGDGEACVRGWPALWQAQARLTEQAHRWSDELAQAPDLMHALAAFASEKRQAAG